MNAIDSHQDQQLESDLNIKDQFRNYFPGKDLKTYWIQYASRACPGSMIQPPAWNQTG